MKVYTKKDYQSATDDFVRVIDSKYDEVVKAVYVGGSVARGDFVPGRSDIDFYIVLRAGNKEELQKKLNEEVKKLEAKYFRDLRYLHDEVIGATVTTLEEIREGCSFLGTGFEYQNFIRTGKLLWGEDIKCLIPRPTLKEQKESAQNFLRDLHRLTLKWEKSFRWLKLVPLKLVPKRNKEKWVRQAFSLIFRSAAVMLYGDGIYVSGKEEVTAAFKRTYPSQRELCNTISQALILWKNWKTRPLSDNEARQLLKGSLEFIKGLQSLNAKRLTRDLETKN
jgi:predicted nucleotidyltransferase